MAKKISELEAKLNGIAAGQGGSASTSNVNIANI